MTNIIKFEYNGNEIEFEHGDGVMINATEMARSFGKEVKHWFENQGTFDFINTLAAHKGISPIGKIPTSLNTKELAKAYPTLIHVVKGGLGKQGTWFQEDVALEFAHWLSPNFAIWCNDHIKELLTNGHTEINRVPTKFSEALRLAAEQAEIIEKQNEIIAIQTPKAEYYDSFMERESLTCLRDTAKQIGIGQKEFIEWLTKKRYIFRNQKNQIRPYMGYCDSMSSGSDNYFRMKDFVDKSGKKVGQQVLITTKGKEHFAKLIKEEKVSGIEELIKDADYTINGN